MFLWVFKKTFFFIDIYKYYLENERNLKGQELEEEADEYEEYIRQKISDLIWPLRAAKKTKDIVAKNELGLKSIADHDVAADINNQSILNNVSPIVTPQKSVKKQPTKHEDSSTNTSGSENDTSGSKDDFSESDDASITSGKNDEEL